MKNGIQFDICEIAFDSARGADGAYTGMVNVTRTGVFRYVDPKSGKVTMQARLPEHVFAKPALDSLKMLPVQEEHNAMLDASNMERYKVGHLGENYRVDSPFVRIPVKVDSQRGIDAIEKRNKKQVSLGYNFDLVPECGTFEGQAYDHVQKNITYNHLALTEKARLGDQLALDSLGSPFAVQTDAQTLDKEPIMEKVIVNGIAYDAAPEVKKALEACQEAQAKAIADLKVANDSKATAEAQRDAMKADKEKADKDLKEAKDSVPALAKAMAKDSAELMRIAAQAMDSAEVEKLDALDSRGIMRAIVVKHDKAADADLKTAETTYGKDSQAFDAYLKSRFDSAKKAFAGKDGNGDSTLSQLRRSTNPRHAAQDTGAPVEAINLDALEKARDEKRRNAYKLTPAKA